MSDRRNGSKPHVWPNIPLLPELVVDNLTSFVRVGRRPSIMGSTQVGDERWPGSSPSGTNVDLPPFYMGKYEVTRAQYHSCVAAGACAYAPGRTGPGGNDANLPVTRVNWYQAITYTKWLQRRLITQRETSRELRRLFEAGWRLDLPSEAEWEKAARKDGTATYPWGNPPNQPDANFNTGRLRAVDASRCRACEYGLFDMAGNVREWTRSLKLPYPYDPAAAEQPSAPGNRAIRGGSFQRQENPVFAARIVRSANRQEGAPLTADEYTGFRVALVCTADGEVPCRWQEPD